MCPASAAASTVTVRSNLALPGGRLPTRSSPRQTADARQRHPIRCQRRRRHDNWTLHASLFAVAGLDDYRQERLEIDLPVASPELAWRHEMSHGVAGYVRSLRSDDQRELERLALVELQRMHDEGGIRFQRGAVAHLGRIGPPGAQSR